MENETYYKVGDVVYVQFSDGHIEKGVLAEYREKNNIDDYYNCKIIFQDYDPSTNSYKERAVYCSEDHLTGKMV